MSPSGSTRGLSAPTVGRRAILRIVAGVAMTASARPGAAQTMTSVLPSFQAALLAKIVSYDRNFAARAIDRAKLLLVVEPNDLESRGVVSQLANALGSIASVGGLPHLEEVVPFSSAASIANTCVSHRISIVYFGPGLMDHIQDIGRALRSVDVLSVAAVPDYVPRGVVLGFASYSDNVKILLNREQGRAQNVNFGARMLRRMTIVG